MTSLVLPLLLAWLAWTSQALGSQYDQALAIEFVKIAGAAYCLPAEIESWTCPQCTANLTSVQLCHATSLDGTQAFVARWNDSCIISVEGTETPWSELADLWLYTFHKSPMMHAMCDGCSVHAGYMYVWEHLQPCIMRQLHAIGCTEAAGSPILVTGHSLGAGVGAIGMLMLQRLGWNVTGGYNFGMPRTGDLAFAHNFTSTFAGKFWRVTHHKDPIVQLPPEGMWPIFTGYAMCCQRYFTTEKWQMVTRSALSGMTTIAHRSIGISIGTTLFVTICIIWT